MADESTQGLILRTRLLTETSLIVSWLTPDLGRLATVAKGARRPKSNFRGKLDLFYIADFSFARSARSELHNLREVALRETHGPLREDITKLQQASYASAFIEQTTETETPLPEVFELTTDYLRQLVSKPAASRIVFAFELRMLELLGIHPDLEATALRPATRALAQALVEEDWDVLSSLAPTAEAVNELRQFLHGFLIFHLGKLPRGRAEALHV